MWAEKRGLGCWIEIKCVECARPTCTHSLLKFLQVLCMFKATTGEMEEFCVALVTLARELLALM